MKAKTNAPAAEPAVTVKVWTADELADRLIHIADDLVDRQLGDEIREAERRLARAKAKMARVGEKRLRVLRAGSVAEAEAIRDENPADENLKAICQKLAGWKPLQEHGATDQQILALLAKWPKWRASNAAIPSASTNHGHKVEAWVDPDSRPGDPSDLSGPKLIEAVRRVMGIGKPGGPKSGAKAAGPKKPTPPKPAAPKPKKPAAPPKPPAKTPPAKKVPAAAPDPDEDGDDEEDDEVSDRQRTLDELSPELRPLMDDPSVNDYGLYVHGVERVKIPMPKSLRASASIEIAEGRDGRWRGTYSYATPTGGRIAAVSVRDVAFESRHAVLMSEAIYLRERFKARHGSQAEELACKQAARAVEDFIATIAEEADAEAKTPPASPALPKAIADYIDTVSGDNQRAFAREAWQFYTVGGEDPGRGRVAPSPVFQQLIVRELARLIGQLGLTPVNNGLWKTDAWDAWEKAKAAAPVVSPEAKAADTHRKVIAEGGTLGQALNAGLDVLREAEPPASPAKKSAAASFPGWKANAIRALKARAGKVGYVLPDGETLKADGYWAAMFREGKAPGYAGQEWLDLKTNFKREPGAEKEPVTAKAAVLPPFDAAEGEAGEEFDPGTASEDERAAYEESLEDAAEDDRAVMAPVDKREATLNALPEELRPLMDDSNVNDDGVYSLDVKEIPIPLPGLPDVKAVILHAWSTVDERFRTGRRVTYLSLGQERTVVDSPPTVRSPGLDSGPYSVRTEANRIANDLALAARECELLIARVKLQDAGQAVKAWANKSAECRTPGQARTADVDETIRRKFKDAESATPGMFDAIKAAGGGES